MAELLFISRIDRRLKHRLLASSSCPDLLDIGTGQLLKPGLSNSSQQLHHADERNYGMLEVLPDPLYLPVVGVRESKMDCHK